MAPAETGAPLLGSSRIAFPSDGARGGRSELSSLIDLMELQRATSDFDFFRSDEGRDAWFERLEAFFEAAGRSAASTGR